MRGFKNFKGSDARCPSIHFLFYALVAAVKKRKFLLERMLEDRQHFPDEDDDDDEDNACVPYGLRNKLHYHYRN